MKVSVVNPTQVTLTVCNAKKVANIRQAEGESKPNESTNLAFRNKAGWLGVIDSAIGGITDGAVKPTPQKMETMILSMMVAIILIIIHKQVIT